MDTELPASLIRAAEELLSRAVQAGQISTADQFAALNSEFSNAIPIWYAQLLAHFPLADLSLGWQAHEPEDDFDGMTWIVLSDASMLRALLESYPAMYLHDRGYFPIANDATGAGNVFLLPSDGGPTSPLYELWHDVAHDPDTLVTTLANCDSGAKIVSNSFTDFIATCPVD